MREVACSWNHVSPAYSSPSQPPFFNLSFFSLPFLIYLVTRSLVAHAGLELNDLDFLGLLFVLPLCWDARCAPPHLVYMG